MSIPLDRLYPFIEHIANKTVELRRFYPHGSKNIEDLNPIRTPSGYQQFISPLIFCNDQEPLDFARYQYCDDNLPKFKILFEKYKLERYNFQASRQNIYDKSLLIHSEKNSVEVETYRNNWFITVYYWSHAVISLDWFRYAKHVVQKKQVNKTFLIYNRAWSGTREYRLKFSELLIRLGLENYCQTSVNPIEPELGIHYELHKFKNSAWRPATVLENFFPVSTAQSHFSADFDIKNYESTDIEVVLETLFDDSRLHLTEKSLRPIACGQPFILAGTSGSLEYLRSYGFITFGDIWDESYDSIEDPEERLIRIADLMRKIANWTPEERVANMAEAQAIAEYNRQRFFSQEFFDMIINELKTNFVKAWQHLESTNTASEYLDRRTRMRADPEIYKLLFTLRSPEDYDQVWKTLEKYYVRGLNN